MRASAAQPEVGPAAFFAWEEVVPGVWVAYAPAGAPNLGGNATVALGPTGAVLVDAKYPATSAALRRESGLLGKPLTTVINTHHHADHTGGNLAFTVDLPVLAHPNAAPRILAQFARYADGIPGMAASLAKVEGEPARAVAAEAEDLAKRAAELKAEQFAPTRSIDLGVDLDLGGLKARAVHPGPAHTDNDIAIFLPDANVLVAGDLVFSGSHAVLDRGAGGTSAGWIRAVGILYPLCDDKTVVVPGHGRHGGRSLLSAQADYLQTLRGLMAEAVQKGVARSEAIKTPAPGEFKDLERQQVYPATLGAIYDEVQAEAGAAGGAEGPK
jgi:cyclase